MVETGDVDPLLGVLDAHGGVLEVEIMRNLKVPLLCSSSGIWKILHVVKVGNQGK